MTHPRTAELVLDGLIADSELKDAVLGDFAEEWSVRELRDGERAANRWYWMQTAMTIPHLMRDWFQQTRWWVVAGAVVAGLAIRLVTILGGAAAFLGGASLFHLLGLPVWATTGLSSLGTAGVAFAGGAFIARLFPRAPMPAVLWLALTVITTTITLDQLIINGLVSPWYAITDKLFSIAGTVAGEFFTLRRKQVQGVRA